MVDNSRVNYIKELLNNIPNEWLKLTTHRLDIYDESLAKTQFLNELEKLVNENDLTSESLSELPTAFDYIRLGHPLSCVLEWGLASINDLEADEVISFDSQTIPLMAVLRKNLISHKKTRILFTDSLPDCFDEKLIKDCYGYDFDAEKITDLNTISSFNGSTILYTEKNYFVFPNIQNVDFFVNSYGNLGSILIVNGESNRSYISEIQHVRRRETVAMTPSNCFKALSLLVGEEVDIAKDENYLSYKDKVQKTIKEITVSPSNAVIGSSGLSMQYAIVMGLIHDALDNHPGKNIKIVVPPNCYGGTNDQARRVAACLSNVEVMDLPVDGGNDMVQSVDSVLDAIAEQDAVPFIIAEIPTNPRVEVPDMEKLRDALAKERTTPSGSLAIDPVFILDQTFCPNVHFLGDNEMLSSVRTIAYVSGSKFPSGGLCTAGYCVSNQKALPLMDKIDLHLNLCDNAATDLQMELLEKQMPSMNQRIHNAYVNTREFVNYIEENLPSAKINFVSEDLASQGFTPSVFSLDLPTKGATDDERESYKRELNNVLISMMISEIPNESKYCVSYGQLKGCYWTIPATSTQGTTKEGDKDYIVRVALSGNMDLDHHKRVFTDFIEKL